MAYVGIEFAVEEAHRCSVTAMQIPYGGIKVIFEDRAGFSILNLSLSPRIAQELIAAIQATLVERKKAQ